VVEHDGRNPGVLHGAALRDLDSLAPTLRERELVAADAS